MDPIGENGLWFLLGLVLGAVASWLVFGWKRRPAATVASRAEPLGAVLERPNALASEMQPPEHQEAIASSRVIDVGAARAAGFNLKHADDLSILEGIGPKIEELLRANGIDSFVKVACANVDDLFDVLERGGPNFHLANPESWPQQATLATQNRWKELKQMQNELNGGSATAPS